MTGLKAGVIKTPRNEGMSFDGGSDHVSVTEGETEFYLKSEADKVIEELKHQRDGAFGLANSGLTLDDISQMAKKEIDRQKCKRCLAMAKMCGVEYDRWLMKKANAIGLGKDGVEYYLKARRKCFHYMRWQPRWVKIAEQFKEAK